MHHLSMWNHFFEKKYNIKHTKQKIKKEPTVRKGCWYTDIYCAYILVFMCMST